MYILINKYNNISTGIKVSVILALDRVQDRLQPVSSQWSVIAMEKQPCVYILTNKRNGTLYIGVTSDLPRRVWEHKIKAVKGFTSKYGIDKLVWYELHDTMMDAIGREKAIKFWKRRWKLMAIEKMNPDWNDLFDELI